MPEAFEALEAQMDQACSHCATMNPAGASFCGSCGQALTPPPAPAAGPRILRKGDVPTTEAGKRLFATELHKRTRKGSQALLIVTVLQFAFGTLLLIMAGTRGAPGVVKGQANMPVLAASVYGIGVVFLGLYFWARWSPLPAAIVGLAVFLTVHLLDAVLDPAALARGLVLKVIIVVLLCKAIAAGLQHRRLTQDSTAGNP